MEHALLTELNAARRLRRAAVVATHLGTGAQRLVTEATSAADPLSTEIAAVLRSGKSGIVEADDGPTFLNVHLPPPRLVAIGAVHITQALAPMARIAGFDVEIVDPRTAFASPERFPDARLSAEWPEEVLSERPLDAYTALCAVTHDPKIDDWPLIRALEAGCFYVGALGSRKTHARRVERLREAGLDEARIARIQAPIGADIGAATPGEIAVSILASVIEALRRRDVAHGPEGQSRAA